jgi:hypothetical protein
VREVRYTPDASGARLQLSATRGAYQPQHKENVAVIHFASRPQSVVWRSRSQEQALATWTFDAAAQTVTIRFPQTSDDAAVVVRW